MFSTVVALFSLRMCQRRDFNINGHNIQVENLFLHFQPDLFQTHPRFPISRIPPLHLPPEFCRMVHMSAVRQLMYHHIIQQLLRQIVKLVVKIQIPFGAAASPTGFLIADCNISERHSHYFRIMDDSSGDPVFDLFHFLICQAGYRRRTGRHLSFFLPSPCCKFFKNPLSVLFDKFYRF